MTDPDRILDAELWDELERLPSRNGKKRRGDVTLRDGRVFMNVGFYEYRLMSVGQRQFRLPFHADEISQIRARQR
jgi:hypothetical protein